jgi:hypothetical protein
MYMNNNITLQDFLKTYTAISDKFIDEYYSFYELCENNMYGINAELIIKYLEFANPRKFFERLKTKYKVNHDFIIKRTIQKLQKVLEMLNIIKHLIVSKKFVCYPGHQTVTLSVIISLH